MNRKIPFLVGLVFVIVSGLAHGLWTGRWRTTLELEQSVEKISHVPMEIGDWKATSEKMDPREQKQAGIVGYAYRRWQNSKTGAGVTMLLVSGPAGPISVHSPEVCYPGVGYNPTTESIPTPIGDAGDQLFSLKLTKDSALSRSSLVVYYGWNGKGEWAASTHPRFDFAWVPVLYKMYLIQEVRGDSDPNAGAAVDFAKLLLPRIREQLFQKSES
jgi:hypothetical protein